MFEALAFLNFVLELLIAFELGEIIDKLKEKRVMK